MMKPQTNHRWNRSYEASCFDLGTVLGSPPR